MGRLLADAVPMLDLCVTGIQPAEAQAALIIVALRACDDNCPRHAERAVQEVRAFQFVGPGRARNQRDVHAAARGDLDRPVLRRCA